MSVESVQVAVRVRPFNSRETGQNSTCIIRMNGPTTYITNPDDGNEKDFNFDYSYWSHDGFIVDENGYNTSKGAEPSKFGGVYADQQAVYDSLGAQVLENAWAGFNCCLFAYGQTGSGKSYSFVGYGANKGIIPQVCAKVFEAKEQMESANLQIQVYVSMLEIYNEKLRDLLMPQKEQKELKIRNDKKLGTYVEGLKRAAVGSYKEIEKCIDTGTNSRTVASTQMNATSSRAHTVVTIRVVQTVTEEGRKKELGSDLNLIDLAGSERAESTGATGDRLKEGAAINQSLSALGNVITALAEQANNPKKKVFIPFRNSKLTQLLQNALGGNSKTIMCCALSPADINFEETLSTLRYADRAKQIKLVVEVQENPTDKLIRTLKEENEKLKKALEAMGGGAALDALNAPAPGEPAPVPEGHRLITEEELKRSIEEAVAQVREASAAERAEALQAVEMEMAARAEAHANGMISRTDMEATLKEVIFAVPGASEAEKQSSLEKALASLSQKFDERAKDGGKIGALDAIRVVTEIINDHAEAPEAERQAAVAAATAQYHADEDGIITEDEMAAGMKTAIAAMPSLKEEAGGKMVEEALVGYTREARLAMGELMSKEVMNKVVVEAIQSMKSAGAGDAAHAAEMADAKFEAMAHQEEGQLTEEQVQTTIERTLGKLARTSSMQNLAGQWAKDAVSKMGTAEGGTKEGGMREQLLQQMEANEAMIDDLQADWQDQLQQSQAEQEERDAMLARFGIGDLSPEEMKTTPSLRNLNEDPLMSDSLVYFLKPGVTAFGCQKENEDDEAAEEYEDETEYSVRLYGAGMMPKHCQLSYDPADGGANRVLELIAQKGVVFVNGKQVEDGTVTALKHNDRIIMGNSQVFKVNDPVNAPVGGGPKQLIDWDLAQNELQEAMGTMVQLKVDEEVAKKKAELEAKLAEMEARFAAENDAMRMELEEKTSMGAADQERLAEMEDRKKAIDVFRVRATRHVNEYRRELIRLETELKKVLPMVREGNQMARVLGRLVKMEPTLLTHVPESTIDDVLSPLEELYTQKVTELFIVVTLHNPRTDQSRVWKWQPENFYNHCLGMRNAYQAWILRQEKIDLHTKEDPFWSPPEPGIVGRSYMYLLPLAHTCESTQWLPIVDAHGNRVGEVSVRIRPTTADFREGLPTQPDTHALLGKPLHFTIRVDSARGLMDVANKNAYVRYTFGDEPMARMTPKAAGANFSPQFNNEQKFTIAAVSADQLRYLQKDAVCFEFYAERDDVEEDDVMQAAELELPPEVFEFFVSIDAQENRVGDLFAPAPLEASLGSDGKHGFVLAQECPHKLVLSLSQSETNFHVRKVGRSWLGNVKDAGGNSVETKWHPCKVTRQARAADEERWDVTYEWYKLPKALADAGARGKAWSIDLKFEISEVDRLALPEPVVITQTFAIKMVSTSDGPPKADELSAKMRAKHMETVQSVYMGKWEVSDDAVNEMMTNMRLDDDDDESGEQKVERILGALDDDVHRLGKTLSEESTRQAADLESQLVLAGVEEGRIRMSIQHMQHSQENLSTGVLARNTERMTASSDSAAGANPKLKKELDEAKKAKAAALRDREAAMREKDQAMQQLYLAQEKIHALSSGNGGATATSTGSASGSKDIAALKADAQRLPLMEAKVKQLESQLKTKDATFEREKAELMDAAAKGGGGGGGGGPSAQRIAELEAALKKAEAQMEEAVKKANEAPKSAACAIL